ncbi:hypothetical protein Q5P01_008631 [Channa striata]|uniref:Uncharacterized protein n=1 Tax=Channa striata TaxID=64152 RepID=A0AA88MZX6_CHASR|nr:hypothetical protein Q5P01_008631 [Channa striata]
MGKFKAAKAEDTENVEPAAALTLLRCGGMRLRAKYQPVNGSHANKLIFLLDYLLSIKTLWPMYALFLPCYLQRDLQRDYGARL